MKGKGIDMINLNIASSKPQAFAVIKGSEKYPDITGIAEFQETAKGVLLTVRVNGLPYTNEKCHNGIYGFHIHKGASCTGNESDPFADTLTHYDPNNCPHPYHAGDLPPLFGNKGSAYMSVLTDRFTTDEILGKTLVIHSMADDFRTQPSGDSGEKIACGVIKQIN